MRGDVAPLVLIWLIVGAFAAFQRGYFTEASRNCAGRGNDRGDRGRGTTQLPGVSIPK